MVNVQLDFKKTAELDKPVPPSAYPVQVKQFKYMPESADERNALPAGKYPYFAVRAEITDGPYAGRMLFCNLTTNPEEATNGSPKNFMLYRFLKVFGLIDDNGQANIDVNMILNQPMTWTVTVKEDDTNNVSGFAKAA